MQKVGIFWIFVDPNSHKTYSENVRYINNYSPCQDIEQRWFKITKKSQHKGNKKNNYTGRITAFNDPGYKLAVYQEVHGGFGKTGSDLDIIPQSSYHCFTLKRNHMGQIIWIKGLGIKVDKIDIVKKSQQKIGPQKGENKPDHRGIFLD